MWIDKEGNVFASKNARDAGHQSEFDICHSRNDSERESGLDDGLTLLSRFKGTYVDRKRKTGNRVRAQTV
jgi:hypothetical protein